MASFLLQEDGSSHLLLEDGSGSILLELSTVTPPVVTPTGQSGGNKLFQPPLPKLVLVEDDEAVALALLLLN